ncbi:hypothetical protein Sviol_28110 [Streptomyces violascens]|uniref:Uncharacterized protein n=1 Tax=Streptomyces violascens TaxID=67381 RepID=A0ABQ3QMC1_9ACTN|nr:hypothetical protein Sviol_28110 [Streptomyces violascens]
MQDFTVVDVGVDQGLAHEGVDEEGAHGADAECGRLYPIASGLDGGMWMLKGAGHFMPEHAKHSYMPKGIFVSGPA